MYLQETYPGVPLHLFGHSFGSLIARKYMQKYDAQLASVTMSGTANYVKVVFTMNSSSRTGGAQAAEICVY